MIIDLKSLGTRISETRKSKKISQITLAETIDISVSHLSDIENGRTNFGIDIFVRIVEALNTSADELLLIESPVVEGKFNSEFNNLISDCSPTEVDSILKMAKEMKSAIKAAKTE